MKNDKKNRMLICMSIVCAISVLGMVAALLIGNDAAEFVPPPFEEDAQTGIPDVPDGIGWGEIDAKVYKAYVCGKIIPEGDSAQIWLYNPNENDVWLKLRIMDEKGRIIGETGLLRAGEYVRSVSLAKAPKKGSAVTMKLMAYEPETYYSAGAVSLNTTIE